MRGLIKILLLLLVTSNVYGQIESIKRFPLQDSTKSITHSLILKATNNNLLIFWIESKYLFCGRSPDGGNTWNEKVLIDGVAEIWQWDDMLTGAVTASGRILLGYKKNGYIYSDDNGITWSSLITLPDYSNGYSFSAAENNKVWLIFESGGALRYRESTEDGLAFGTPKLYWNDPDLIFFLGNIVQINDSTLFSAAAYGSIYGKFSFNNGETWDEPFVLSSGSHVNHSLNTIKTDDSTIVIIFDNNNSSDVEFIKSFDSGYSWTDSESFTKYVGFDGYPSAAIMDGKIISSFSSDRTGENQIWLGIIEESEDIETPPVIESIYPMSGTFVADSTFIVRTKVIDESEIVSVIATPYVNDVELSPLQLYDDGLHNDNEANDDIFGNSFPGYSVTDTLKFKVEAVDSQSLKVVSWTNNIYFNHAYRRKEVLIDVNNFLLPINNRGILADVAVLFPDGSRSPIAKFEESGLLFSGGFALSGERYYHLWANGNMTSSRVEDYVPGNVYNAQDDSLNMIYIIYKTDTPFGPSWREWENAVKLGADFYDGDNDGIYNPVDLNENGEWDVNEDMPDLLGDLTAWCVFNDGVAASSRYYNNMHPLGIEIKQTVFAYSEDSFPELSNVIFVRYKIENIEGVTQKLDSVYFSVWADGDLGDYVDDLTGTEKELNSIFIYNDGEDSEYGTNPPSMFVTLLQGPQAFVPGETYADNNQNGRYDEGIDTPLKDAILNRGQLLKNEVIHGAKNLNTSSGIAYMKSHPEFGDPNNEFELRYYMLGLKPEGTFRDPCLYEYGEVVNDDCNSIDPLFWFSGDPVKNKGWMDRTPSDKRYLISSGPFVMDTKPIEIIVAYSVGRGVDVTNSITVARDIVKDVFKFYESNFTEIPVSISEEKSYSVPTEFSLSQNYPNPFNPTTTIEYRIPQEVRSKKQEVKSEGSIVKMIIYDVLGREVATLVNKLQAPGNYKVNFNANHLASGVYFYRLSYGSYIQSKKMLLLK